MLRLTSTARLTIRLRGPASGSSLLLSCSGHSLFLHQQSGFSMVAALDSAGAWKRITYGTPPYDVYSKPIHKSPHDDREYRLIRLDNGLQAMLVHHTKAEKCAASLDVAVGHLHDPDDMPGLAHFCEHLLFMGTEQYPKENEYSEYLSKNGGSSNAYTATSNTNFYFSVSPSAFSGALERFASFFHSPLFSPSCTVRELNAVDSEHKKNHQSDAWRIFQVNKHLTKDGHPWSKFGSGNKKSLSKVGEDLKAKESLNGHISTETTRGSLSAVPALSRAVSPASDLSESEGDGGVVGREIRRRLVEWWSKEYCASRMRLCMIGKESLDELSVMAANLFSPIPNRGQEPLPMIPDHPFGLNEMGTLVSVQTVMSFHALEISFPLGHLPSYWKYKPANFLSHFIGHEGPGSLHSYLKEKSWITGLSTGPQNLARGFGMFKITISMTPEGFENYETLVQAVFKCIALLKESEFPAWQQQESSLISATRFRFAEKRRPDDYAVWISEHLAWPVPRELVLSAPQLVDEWDVNDAVGGGEREMREMLNSLTIERSRIVLMANAEEHERVRGKNLLWEKEPWYGTPYCVEKFSEELVNKANEPNDIKELHLPGPNEFIPKNLNVEKREVEKPAKRPCLIRETPLSSLWYKKDDQFWVPKAQVVMDLRTPAACATARATVMTRLFSDLVTDSLTEFAYNADLAGLTYSLSHQSLGVYIVLNGYNDKLYVLAQDVLERARNLKVRPDRLAVMKDQAKREYENWLLGSPYHLSNYYARYLLSERGWTREELLAEVNAITPEELQAHVNSLLSTLHIRMAVVGNMYKDEACKLAEMAENILKSEPMPADQLWDSSLILPPGSNYVWSSPVPNKNEANNALTYCLPIAKAEDRRRRVLTALLAHILSEPAFNILRTREQLGYIVSASHWSMTGGGQTGISITVQSERDPKYLERRVDAFLGEMRETLANMSGQDFSEHKVALQKLWREAPKNLSEEMNRFWPQIQWGYLDFYRRDLDCELIEDVTKDELMLLFRSAVDPSSAERAKLSVHLYSQKPRLAKISASAMEAFARKVAEKGYTVDEQAWRGALAADGDVALDIFGKYWRDTLLAQAAFVPPAVAQSLTATVPALLKEYPSADEGKEEIALDEQTVSIQDAKAFRASLSVSERPHPLVEWGDLPASKY